MSIASWTSPPASASTFPISWVMSSVSSALCSVDKLREAEEDLAALRRRDEPPLVERLLRGRDCAIDVLGAGAREDADQLAVGGARRLEGLARGGVDPLAADVVLEFAHGCGSHAASLVSTKPVLFLDVDGVLNPFPDTPAGFNEYDFFPEDDEPVRLAAVHRVWLHQLAVVYELVWATGWGDEANRVLNPFFGLATLPVVQFPDVPFEPSAKVPGVDRVARDRPSPGSTTW